MLSTSPSDGRIVVALVATRARTELLSRAIPAIVRQARLPERVLVVVDRTREDLSDAALKDLTKAVRALCGDKLHATIVRNLRTRQRAAGAWNTGIDTLHRDARLIAKPDICFVAILDDDDSWEPDHLDLCLRKAVAGDLTMVAPGLIRHERADDVGHRHSVPERLDAREQFIRGQHIQGSNLFVRLDTLLKVGGFDEYLPSCTDRDLCIRMCDLPDLRFGSVPQHTVHHFADSRADRLSAPASREKLDGLTRFWWKYADRFDEDARRLAAERALKLFGWALPVSHVATAELSPPGPAPRRVDLVLGFVTDAAVPAHVRGLLDDSLALARHADIATLKVVVLENGPLPRDDERPLHRLAEAYRSRGLDVDLVTIERQREDWAQGRLVDTPDPTQQRLPIAVTRTLLNTYVSRAAAERQGAWAWILDDDKRLHIRVDRGDGSVVERPTPDLAALCALQDTGVDVVIGPDTDAAPLPFTATLRMQLVDLLHCVRLIGAARPEYPWIDRSARDAAARRGLPESYYDLSRAPEHLETPFTLPPGPDLRTAADMLAHIAARVDRLLAGEQVFRPLVIDALTLPVDAAVDSMHRGGSTIFFRPGVLLEYPQTLARLGDLYVRRSDMLVSQLMRDQLALRIVMHPAAGVRHDRSGTKWESLKDETLRTDVLGYALYRAADEIMRRRTIELRREPLLAWSAHELEEAARLVRKYVNERLAALTLSGWRIVGLAEAIREAARGLAVSSRWLTGDARRIEAEMDRICGNFKPNAVAEFAERIRRSAARDDIRNAFASMDGVISEYRATRIPVGDDRGLAAARDRRSRALLKRAFGADSLRLLGIGGEGIVFTDEQRVYKAFDVLKRRPNHDTLETLRTLSDRLEQPKYLYRLTRVAEYDKTLLIVYPYEPSEPYAGGRGAEIIGLLRECKSNGIFFRNMHPKNLRVSTTGLKLVDYGSDIRPFSESGYRSMAQRAWLTWRWSHRPDLDELMRRALTNDLLPELGGFERFWAALRDEKPSATRIVSGMVDPIVLDSGARNVLDYGCGKKARSARRLADAGIRVVGFDPGSSMPVRWKSFDSPPGLELTTDRAAALSKAPFDAVLCSQVLCELGEGPEYEQILRDLRSVARDDGIVVVTVCNPFATFGAPTALHHRRQLPEGATYKDRFWFEENAETGAGRREFHRPLSHIERDLQRLGLRVERRIESKTVDVDRFEPASDFLTLVCRPVQISRPDHRISLVIKTCAMEAHTIERQVEHLVGQLTGPRVFYERILVIDSLRDAFVRQHAPADWEGVHAAARRLQDRGLIDRIVVGPTDAAEISRLNRDWLGIDSDVTHTTEGAPLAAPLHGFEACAGDFILQVDSDLLIGRIDRGHDYLGEAIEALETSPAALTVSLNVARGESLPFSAEDGGRPWRMEVRGCLFHRARLLAARPFPNRVVDGRPELSWHRAMDEAVSQGKFASLRGGGHQTFFVHPPNDAKLSVADWMLLVDLIEKGYCPANQIGKVDLTGGPLDWVPRNRAEPFIFIITGRNVPPGRMRACLESMAAQRRGDWGAVLIDDGSAPWAREYLQFTVEPWRERITLLQPRERRGQMANMTLAIRHICTNPDSVLVTLDLDDTLIGTGVLDRVTAEYNRGADVTVGSMLRTDKHVEYPVTFENPRFARGGNVWQHLRTFRKSLFDAIPDHELRLDGHNVDIAVDWAFMLPIVEMAKSPAWIRDPLYLYEPSGLGKGPDREARERQIGQIVAKPARRRSGNPRPLLRAEDIASVSWPEEGGILFIRHGERPSFKGLDATERDAVQLTDGGRATAIAMGRALPKPIQVVSSPVLRSVETAEAIAEAAGLAPVAVRQMKELVRFRIADEPLYEAVKRRLGWAGMMSAWTDGSIPHGILIPCHQAAASAIAAVRTFARGRVVAVTHDFMVIALLAALHGVRNTAVPYLGGVFVTREEEESLLNSEVHA